ncbi:hypothetical protein AKO1_007150 [Acrasis kona]|uniref:Protein-S-isoprenylcysteine O-methyltransferase n=1 Tax=Acrasis kona TaxID=1008807 RepID=A0AAW2YT29_9EUKA
MNGEQIVVDVTLLIVAAVTLCKALANPNKLGGKPDVNEGHFLKFAKNVTPPLVRSFVTGWTVTYVTLMILQDIKSPYLHSLCPNRQPGSLLLSSIQLIGFVLVMVGSLTRLWCFHTLGSFFTFDVAILPQHKLIRSGPYAYVRHPSYTAILFMVTGSFMLCRNEWIFCFLPSSSKDIIGHWMNPMLNISFVAAFIIKRVSLEEKLMSEYFKDEFKDYESKTYKYLPFIL